MSIFNKKVQKTLNGKRATFYVKTAFLNKDRIIGKRIYTLVDKHHGWSLVNLTNDGYLHIVHSWGCGWTLALDDKAKRLLDMLIAERDNK